MVRGGWLLHSIQQLTMNKIRFLWFTLSALFLAWTFTGCTTNQVTAAYKVEAATTVTVQAAMTGWGTYVALYHPGTNAEQKVFNAFQIWQSSELAMVDATASLASDPTNTAPAQAAQNAVAASQLDLINLIASLTNTLPAQ
jgi:hypothetical protein